MVVLSNGYGCDYGCDYCLLIIDGVELVIGGVEQVIGVYVRGVDVGDFWVSGGVMRWYTWGDQVMIWVLRTQVIFDGILVEKN